ERFGIKFPNQDDAVLLRKRKELFFEQHFILSARRFRKTARLSVFHKTGDRFFHAHRIFFLRRFEGACRLPITDQFLRRLPRPKLQRFFYPDSTQRALDPERAFALSIIPRTVGKTWRVSSIERKHGEILYSAGTILEQENSGFDKPLVF